MAQAVLVAESKLTDRFQTTVPSLVRQALHLGKKDTIKYTIQENGDVLMSRAVSTDEDPILESFLSFLANDMQLTANMCLSVENLVEDVEIDIDTSLLEEDE
ncbi:type II toxin-antitoxin system PrlF family antitoxin [Shewanella sp. AC91-MNA-CIBAN-0169]|uniref:type II toxin-antitoxin system PrlF family antitoxin n=1 Tax=Shewanella sp. AC91-MNA-CIBAN-0169 TaxID=3140466 RepID=UPI003331857C